MASLAHSAPGMALISAAGLLGIALALHFRAILPRTAAATMIVLLGGYALFNRSFAYMGVAPLFVGEISLLIVVTAALMAGRPGRVFRSGPALALLFFQLVSFVATAPYLTVYGLEALRDAVLWAYGLFALAILALASGRSFSGVARVYARFVPWFLCLIPVMLLTTHLAPGIAGSVKLNGIPVLDPKSGDVAVHLAGIGVFMILGLHKSSETGGIRLHRFEWIVWMLWLISFALITDSRGGMLAVAAAILVVLVLGRRRSGVLRPLLIGVAVVVLASVWQIQVGGPSSGRDISVNGIVHRLQSSFTDTGDRGVDGTKAWRLSWWSDIMAYTIGGQYRWLGKGYGINLADADGYQVAEDGSLRSPHNGHLTILARSGVIGLGAWLLFLGTLLFKVGRLSVSKDDPRHPWALWILGYLIAVLVNASFDVYLEGPQGGLWFWAMVGGALTLVSIAPTRTSKSTPTQTLVK